MFCERPTPADALNAKKSSSDFKAASWLLADVGKRLGYGKLDACNGASSPSFVYSSTRFAPSI